MKTALNDLINVFALTTIKVSSLSQTLINLTPGIPFPEIVTSRFSISQNLARNTSSQVFAAMIGHSRCSTIRMPKEVMASSLTNPLKSQMLKECHHSSGCDSRHSWTHFVTSIL
jgi:hypothetical protein